MPKYLIQQRRVWYAVLEIPKALRPKFGKARFKETLHTESLTIAQRKVHAKISEWKNIIEVMRSGADHIEVRKAEWRMLAEQDRRKGMTEEEIKELSLDVAASTYRLDPDILEVHNATFGSWVNLSEFIDGWIAASDCTAKTNDMRRHDVSRFSKKFKYAHDATPLALMQWVEIDLMDNAALTAATCRRIISSCRGYWRWLERHKQLNIGQPFDNAVPRVKSKATKRSNPKRQAFTKSDFQKLLDQCPTHYTALGDVIILGAYTGARIEELCGLELGQVKSDRFIIQDAKTDAGWREIPIHSKIADLVSRLKAQSSDGYLLTELTKNKYGDRSNAIGKRFGRLKTRLGYGPEHVFHSLRKLLSTSLENAGVPENVSARLLGHELGTMSYGLYSGGLDFLVLKEAIEKVDLSAQRNSP